VNEKGNDASGSGAPPPAGSSLMTASSIRSSSVPGPVGGCTVKTMSAVSPASNPKKLTWNSQLTCGSLSILPSSGTPSILTVPLAPGGSAGAAARAIVPIPTLPSPQAAAAATTANERAERKRRTGKATPRGSGRPRLDVVRTADVPRRDGSGPPDCGNARTSPGWRSALTTTTAPTGMAARASRGERRWDQVRAPIGWRLRRRRQPIETRSYRTVSSQSCTTGMSTRW
jgi:hypothetical protein